MDEAADLLRELAGNRRADESMKAVLRRVRRRLADWKPSRVRDIWYRDPRVKLRAGEIEQLRSLVDRKAETKAAVDELAELRNRISRLETLLERSDPTFHREAIDTLRSQRRALG
ncbi:hypothetical protein [Nitrobacter hamburgensis]|uniref:hypothetical protein n=1 Tax=Nitrobacter hamburgensis TaxID=912 RepID=UPI0018DC65EE|nr:hypothetical protein [Nitrobacter hamburgensis]